MHYLGLALYAEGPSDYRFLCPLLLRLCEEACSSATQPVDIGDVLALGDPIERADGSRADRIAQAAVDAAPAWNVLFVHADADSDAVAAMRDRVLPGLSRLMTSGLARAEGVAVVPVRVTEAWTLADGDALRAVFGTILGDDQLGLAAHGRGVEQLTDPKQVLEAACAAALPRGRRHRMKVGYFLNALGEEVSLQRLRDLPSFARLESDLVDALRRLQILG